MPGLDLGHGRQLGHEPGGQLLQLGRGLVLQDQVVHGGEAVLEGVARGAGLALLGDGPARAGAVAAGSLDLGGVRGRACEHGGRPSGSEGSASEYNQSRIIYLESNRGWINSIRRADEHPNHCGTTGDHARKAGR